MNAVKVAIRVRPLLERELIKHCKECIYVLQNKNQLIVGKNQNFIFDHVFGQTSEQHTLYEEAVKPLVLSCIDGYNATVFTYGQTGSGKTHTIEGGSDVRSQGIIPRTASDLFTFVECSDNDTKYQIKVSYLEIYLEEIRDLLSDAQDEIFIREDERGNTIIQGLKEIPVNNLSELEKLLRYGAAIRTTGATQMNAHSSRSHAILTFHVERTSNTSSRKIEVTSAKFHLVDLAGSERAQRTGNMGDRFKESVYINSGLLALGNVISALTDAKRKTSHIPYRESKITRLLKDSLGGNSKTLMITCVSPSNDSLDETLNSLKYAKRARSIHNTPTMNKSIIEMEMQRMESEILHLREQLKTRENSTTSANSDLIVESLTEKNCMLEMELTWYSNLVSSCKSLLDQFLEDPSDLKVITNVMEKLSAEESKNADVFQGVSDEENYRLRLEIKQYKQDLQNDEKIFAERQIEFDQIQTELKTQILAQQKEISKLKTSLEARRHSNQWTRSSNVIGDIRDTGNKDIVITRTQKSTQEDINRIIQEKAQALLLEHLDTNFLAAFTPKDDSSRQMEGAEIYCQNRKIRLLSDEIKQLKGVISQQKASNGPTHQSPSTTHSIVVKKSQVKPFTAPRSRDTASVSTSLKHGTLDDVVEKIEKQLQQVLEKRRLLKDQQLEVKKRDATIRDKDYIKQEMKKLEEKEVRVSQVMSKDLIRIKNKIDQLDASISHKVSNSVSGGISRVAQEVTVLQNKRDDLMQKVKLISDKINSGDLLSDKEQAEYRNLQECLETTVIALNYRTDIISENSRALSFDEVDIDIPVNEAVVKELFKKLILCKEDRSNIVSQKKLLELQLDSKVSELSALHSSQLISPRSRI